MLMKPNNPFLISGYQGPEYFCDREEESRNLMSALKNGRNVTLAAPRRLGKTGLIRHVFYKLKEAEPDIVCLYMDIYPTACLADFVRLLAETVLGSLDSAPQKILARISSFVRSCRPAMTFDEVTGAPKVSLELAAGQEETTLKEIFAYLGSADKRCYIAIDEFQQINEYPEKGTEALLRSHIQSIANVNFIFSGSRQSLMQEMFASQKRPFYQSTQLMTLGVIGREKYSAFACGFFSAAGRELPESVFNEVYSRYEGHTWYVQYLLNRLYSYDRDINSELAAVAESQVIDELSCFYADLLKAYAPGQVSLLKAIASEGCVAEPLSGGFISRHLLKSPSSVQSALHKLVDKELVYRGSEGYIVYDRFMGEYLRRG